MINENLVEPLAFLSIALGIVLILSFVFYWGFKFASLNEDEELKKLRETVKVKDALILRLRAEVMDKDGQIVALRLMSVESSLNENK